MTDTIDITELLTLSSRATKEGSSKVGLSIPKALVFWFIDTKTSIVDKEDFITPEDFVAGKTTEIKWRTGRKLEVFSAKVIEIGELSKLKKKQDELDLLIYDHQQKQVALTDSVNISVGKRGRKAPSLLADYVLDIDDDDQTLSKKGKKGAPAQNAEALRIKAAALKKKKEEHVLRVAEQQRRADELFALPPLHYTPNIRAISVVSPRNEISASASIFARDLVSASASTFAKNQVSASAVAPTDDLPDTDTSLTSSLIRQAMHCVDSGTSSPIITLPDTQPMDLDTSSHFESDDERTWPREIISQPTNSFFEPFRESDDNQQQTINSLTEDLKTKDKIIQELQAKLGVPTSQGNCLRCRALSDLGPSGINLLDALYNCVTSGPVVEGRVGHNTSTSSQPIRSSQGTPNMVELHPGSDVWVPAQMKSMAILKARGRPNKLMALCLEMLYSKKDLGKFSVHGQRENCAFPRKESDAIKQFTLKICQKDSPNLTDVKMNKVFNRIFGMGRQAVKRRSNKRASRNGPVQPASGDQGSADQGSADQGRADQGSADQDTSIQHVGN